MFAEAYKKARQFTFPIFLLRRTVAGECSSSIGAFVVVNEEGWIVTAGHIMDQLHTMQTEYEACARSREQAKKIEADASLDFNEKKRRLRSVPKLNPNTTQDFSMVLAINLPDPPQSLDPIHFIGPADLGLAKLSPFDPAWVKEYPVFKDPSKELTPGTSLCKLGYPFHAAAPTWKEDGGFELGGERPPLFPIEGIFTRNVNVNLPAGIEPPPFQVRFLETSSPGLKGQSGGPTFDQQGTVWAIQSMTQHFHLGFDPPVPGRPHAREHQFLNVGMGVHPSTLVGAFNHFGIKHRLSEY